MMHKPTRWSLAALIVATALPMPPTAAAQDEALPAERNLYLECILQTGDYGRDHRLAINPAVMRAHSGSLDGTGGLGSYGVRFESDEIILYPNRPPAAPEHTNLAIDRQTLALTYFRRAGIDSPARIVVGTAQCHEIAPVPGLMPGEGRSAR